MVFTPHPGEMGRLISKTSKEVQANRWDIARGFAKEYDVVTVLKGAGDSDHAREIGTDVD